MPLFPENGINKLHHLQPLHDDGEHEQPKHAHSGDGAEIQCFDGLGQCLLCQCLDCKLVDVIHDARTVVKHRIW